MELYSGYINKLIEQFAKLPGIGSKSAQPYRSLSIFQKDGKRQPVNHFKIKR